MTEDFSHLNNEERIRAENNVLKMKLMLEKGARFHEQEEELPAEIEHEFLKHVIAFEQQIEDRKVITVMEKLGNPAHWRPVANIPDEEIELAWQQLDQYMRDRGISLDVCSPNVPARELYRFSTEELFRQEMDDFSFPGMMYCFIYDEFHSDPMYENGRAAIDTMRNILSPEAVECFPHLRRRNLKLNNRSPLLVDEFKSYVNQFKQAYEHIDEPELEQISCEVNQGHSIVRGTFKLRASLRMECIALNGQWSIELEFDDDLGYWYIFNVQVQGINF